MATKSKGTPVQGLQKLYLRLRRDAEGLLARGRRELASDVRSLQRRANRATREFEASVLKRVHAASDAQLRRLERRVAGLEKRLENLERTGDSSAQRGAA